MTRPKAAAKADEWIYVLAGSEAGFGSGLANEPGSNSSATGAAAAPRLGWGVLSFRVPAM